MNKISFAIDMDGTVYKGGNPIPGAKEFISFLKNAEIPFVFLTNNSSHAREYYYQKLKGMGFDVGLDNILTSTVAAVEYLKQAYPGETVFPIASPEVIAEIGKSGIKLSEKDPDVVLLTFDKTITYEKLNIGYHAAMNGSPIIATHPDDLCPTEDSYDVDIGPFIRLFESLTKKDVFVVGKPNITMLKMAASVMGTDEKSVIMVGDRLYTDMKMAHDAGIRSVMVLSGEATREDLEGSEINPTYVLDSVADIPGILKDLLRC